MNADSHIRLEFQKKPFSHTSKRKKEKYSYIIGHFSFRPSQHRLTCIEGTSLKYIRMTGRKPAAGACVQAFGQSGSSLFKRDRCGSSGKWEGLRAPAYYFIFYGTFMALFGIARFWVFVETARTPSSFFYLSAYSFL